jgi:acetyl esterase/lipase
MPKNDDITFWKNMSLGRRDVVIKGLGPPPKGITEQDHQVKMRDGTKIVIRSYTPDKAPEGGSPLIVQFHGGGFCVGGLENETPTCRNLALELGAVVLNVEYRLAPEFKFPLPVNDAWDSVKWVRSNNTSSTSELALLTYFVSHPGSRECICATGKPTEWVYSWWFFCWR